MKPVRAIGIHRDEARFSSVRKDNARHREAPALVSTTKRMVPLVFALAICFLLSGISSAVKAQSPNPHAVSMYNLGLTAYKQGSPESAIIFFKRACDIDPNLVDAQYNLGVIYQSQKRLREAAPRFEQVLRMKPSDPDAHYQLALVLLELGQTQEARQHFASIPPNNMHFTDAQKRLGTLEPLSRESGQVSQQAGLSAQAPSTQTAYPPNYDKNQVGTISSPSQPFATSDTVPQPAPPIQPIGPSVTQTSSQNNYATPFAPPATQPSQSVSYAQPDTSGARPQTQTVSNPVPVIANSSVKVIASGFSAPSGLAFDKNGNLYVANFLTNTVDRIGVDGNRSQFSAGAHLKGPIGLCIDDLGNVYVANYSGGTVARINPAGVSAVIATGFRKPYYLTLDRDGNIFVSQQEDNSVVRIALPRPVSSKL